MDSRDWAEMIRVEREITALLHRLEEALAEEGLGSQGRLVLLTRSRLLRAGARRLRLVASRRKA